jgi:hypothetical protein
MFIHFARIRLAMCVAKFVGAQCGVKKKIIWVAKPIVSNFLGPNLVGDQQAIT